MIFKYVFPLFFFIGATYGFPQYYCTGANWAYFDSLLNLIGSIHDTNFDQLEEIAVFDLGLQPDQIKTLENIQKVSVHPLEKTDPEITTYYRGHGIVVFGWYAWKWVAIKQALDLFPYVLWVDAGTEVRNSMDFMFQYVHANDYFICTIGDHKDSRGHWKHPVGWGTTQFVKSKFGLGEPEKRWILEQESVMGGFVGATRKGAPYFIDDLYEWTRDLRNYADDGTAPNGWGCARHDQVLLSYLAYSKNLTIHLQDGTSGAPILIPLENGTVPFYITYSKNFVRASTHIFNVRTDKTNHPYYHSKIRKKGPEIDI